MTAMGELGLAMNVPPPADAPDAPTAINDAAAMTRAVLVGLAVSIPLWLGILWIVSWLARMLPVN